MSAISKNVELHNPVAEVTDVSTSENAVATQPKSQLVRRVEQAGLLAISALSGLAAMALGLLGLTIGFGGAPFAGPGAYLAGMIFIKLSLTAALFTATSFFTLLAAVRLEQKIRDERPIAPFENQATKIV